MEQERFQEWLSKLDGISPSQRRQLVASLEAGAVQTSSLSAIDVSVGEDRRCPHCAVLRAISRGKARGLRRYQCKTCRKIVNAGRHDFAGAAQEGQVPRLWHLPR